MMTTTGKRVSEMQENQCGEVLMFEDEVLANRMMAMGILPGSQMTLIRKAPFSGGFYLKIDNNRVALRNAEAASIMVKAR